MKPSNHEELAVSTIRVSEWDKEVPSYSNELLCPIR
jgi:hypothetical protein